MDILMIVLLIVVIYLLVTLKSDMGNKIADLERTIAELKLYIKKRLDEPKDLPINKPVVQDTPKPQVQANPRPIPQPEPAKPKPSGPEAPKPLPEVERHNQVISTPERPAPPTYRTYDPEPRRSFFERYPDLEKFIGENLINKIGIAILVLAIGYFVKFAIDNNWVGPVGRVAIGVLCGSILIAFAHKLRKDYAAFSSVLAGGGLAIYYFIITLAFQEFHLFGQTTAFIILIAITIFSVALSLLYNKQELAIIALVGGQCSPFMVSNGHSNFNAFFMYLTVLNTGLLIIAYYKSWRILNISAFGLTALVYVTVLFNLPTANNATGFIYGTVFYLLFLAINIAHNVKEGKAFIASDYSILLINTALYFSAGLYLISDMGHPEYRGLFSAGLGAVNLVLSYILFRNKKVDTNILYLLIGITLTFISLTAPIQLHGNNITLFWSAEAVLLYWLFQKSGIKLMKVTSLLVWVLMLGSLGMDWIKVYSDTMAPLTILANKGFITTLCAAISTYLLYLLVNKDTTERADNWDISPDLLQGLAFVLLYASGGLEINHQFSNHFPGCTSLTVVYLMLYTTAFARLFTLFALGDEETQIGPYLDAGLITAAIAVYLIFIPDAFTLQRLMLEKGTPNTLHFWAHWIGALFTALLFNELIVLLRDEIELPDWSVWLVCGGIVIFLSFEVCLISNRLFYSATYPFDRVETVFIKTGLPVLWGLLSFAMMWLGMRYKQRTLRIISLSLFTLTLLKLFLFDIRNIPAAGKIAAFFCLGVLLLIVSFMYQKVKKIIADDEETGQDS